MIGSPSVGKLHSNCLTPGEEVGPATCLCRWKYQNPLGVELKKCLAYNLSAVS